MYKDWAHLPPSTCSCTSICLSIHPSPVHSSIHPFIVCVCVCVCVCSVVPGSLQHTRLLCPWDFPGKNTAVDYHSLLLGNLPDPGIKLASPMSPALQVDSLPLSHWRSPSILLLMNIQRNMSQNCMHPVLTTSQCGLIWEFLFFFLALSLHCF